MGQSGTSSLWSRVGQATFHDAHVLPAWEYLEALAAEHSITVLEATRASYESLNAEISAGVSELGLVTPVFPDAWAPARRQLAL